MGRSCVSRCFQNWAYYLPACESFDVWVFCNSLRIRVLLLVCIWPWIHPGFLSGKTVRQDRRKCGWPWPWHYWDKLPPEKSCPPKTCAVGTFAMAIGLLPQVPTVPVSVVRPQAYLQILLCFSSNPSNLVEKVLLCGRSCPQLNFKNPCPQESSFLGKRNWKRFFSIKCSNSGR